MNREFKFRAWETTENKMYYQVRVGGVFNGEPTAPTTYIKGKGWVNLIGGDYTKVMEYTGLKDCNGKEIYEGDILKITYTHKSFITERIGKVIYGSLGRFQLKGENIHCAFNHIVNFNMEIIGNIYENPELVRI